MNGVVRYVLVAVTSWGVACAHDPKPEVAPVPETSVEPPGDTVQPPDPSIEPPGTTELRQTPQPLPETPPIDPHSLPHGPVACQRCGPAPGYPTGGCADPRYQSGRGDCIELQDGTCRWLRMTCPESQPGQGSGECNPQECGSPPKVAKWLCPDGVETGEYGPCKRGRDGCGWVHRRCLGAARPPGQLPVRDQPRPTLEQHGCAKLPSDAELKKWEVRSMCSPGSGPAPPPVTRIKSLDDGTHILEMHDRCFRAHYKQCFTKCLPPEARIDTPQGALAIAALRTGMPIWTQNKRGQRIVGQVLETATVPVSGAHDVAVIRLQDGRSITASLQHPVLGGRLIEDLRVGDNYDSVAIISIEVVPYEQASTYDVLPSGDTGIYWANGVPLRSTLGP